MAKKTVKSEWNSWETLPEDGAGIVVKNNETQHESNGQYLDGGITLNNGEGWTIATLPYDVWKLKPSDPDAEKTKTAAQKSGKDKSKQFSLSIPDEDLRRYIADGLRSDYGAAVADMWTNADGGFIVYGSGLGKVQS